jgi:hypothetical protein
MSSADPLDAPGRIIIDGSAPRMKNQAVKRTLALLIAVAVVVAAALGAGAVKARRDRDIRREASHAAETAASQASDALAGHVADLKLEAHNAASTPRLVAALRGNVDGPTLQDLFRSEDWWEPYRRSFKVYAVAFGGEKLDVIEGMRNAEFSSDLLIREARDRNEAVAEIVMGKGWPYAAAAVAMKIPEREIPVVLVLAKPIDEAAVRKLSERARGAVLLSDGKSPVIQTGPEAERELLRTAVGSETRGPVFAPPEGSAESWAAAVSQLAPGLWMWTFASGAAAARDTESTAAATRGVIWAVGILLALVALALGFRRGQPAGAGVVEGAEATASQIEASLAGTAPRLRPATNPAARLRTEPGTGAPPAAVSGSAATEFHRSDPEVARPTAAKGVAFGRYTLVDRLGEGGMAEVYTAVTFGAEGFRRTFVVKRLRAELTRDPSVVAQFIDEANLGSTLVHSNIIPVFDFGKVGDEYFLAQEYILGRDLGRLTARSVEKEGQPLGVPVVLHAAVETLKALEYAHTKLGDTGRPLGIVHRDVSPSNILISARGEVKLFDFGIVKAEGRVTKTQHGVVKGNVSFMSPEQARGIDVDARADLFSLGLVIFYCLTGDVLYHGATTYELLVKAATGPEAEELARLRALPAPCGDILVRALEVDPARRFQTAAEFAAALTPHFPHGKGASDAGALMRALFGDDFQAEEARFAAALPGSDRGAQPGRPGTSELASRRP